MHPVRLCLQRSSRCVERPAAPAASRALFCGLRVLCG